MSVLNLNNGLKFPIKDYSFSWKGHIDSFSKLVDEDKNKLQIDLDNKLLSTLKQLEQAKLSQENREFLLKLNKDFVKRKMDLNNLEELLMFGICCFKYHLNYPMKLNYLNTGLKICDIIIDYSKLDVKKINHTILILSHYIFDLKQQSLISICN